MLEENEKFIQIYFELEFNEELIHCYLFWIFFPAILKLKTTLTVGFFFFFYFSKLLL